MSENEFKLRREVEELKAEVKGLKRIIEVGFAVVGLAIIAAFPQHLQMLIVMGVLSMMCSALFLWRGGQQYDPPKPDGPNV